MGTVTLLPTPLVAFLMSEVWGHWDALAPVQQTQAQESAERLGLVVDDGGELEFTKRGRVAVRTLERLERRERAEHRLGEL